MSGRRACSPRRGTTTRRVARTFALACRLLPREVRDDVYLLYLVFRTLDDLVDDGMPEAAARIAAVEAWAAGEDGPRDARGRRARGPGDAPSDPARRARRLLRRHAPRPRRAAAAHGGRRRRLLLPGGRDRRRGDGGDPRHRRPRGRPPRRRRAGDGDAADEHPARHRRGPRRRARLPRRGDRARASAARSPRRRARGSCATRSRAPTGSTNGAARASRCCRTAAGRWPPRPACIARSCARSSARATAPRAAARSVPRPRKLLIAARRGVLSR